MKVLKNIEKKNIGLILFIIIVLCDIYMVTVKLHFGMYFDESFLIAQAECFTREIDFFKDSWSAFQFAGVIISPISYAYKSLVGSNDGIIYFYRIIWLMMQNALVFTTYKVLSKSEIPGKDGRKVCITRTVAACVSLCLYFYFAYFYSVNYKTLAYWGCAFIVLLLVHFYRTMSILDTILLGLVLSLATLSYESTAIMIIPILFCIVYVCKNNKCKAGKYSVTTILTCAICAGIFIGYVIFQIGISDFIKYFDKFLGYEGYGQNIFIKLGKHAVFFIGAFVLNYVLVITYEKFLKDRMKLSMYIFIYMTLLMAAILFAKPQTITISRVHYIMCVTYTLCIVLALKCLNKEQKNYYLYLYFIPIGFYVLSIAIATYQGIAVSSMGCILTIIPLFLLSSKEQLNMKGAIASTTIMMSLVGLIVVPCIYTTNLTVFHPTVEITEGPAKGTKPLDTYVNEDIAEWQQMVDKYVKDTDKPLMLGNQYYSVGYLYCDCEKYGTYSPGYVFLDSDRLVKFWNMNTDRQPTVAIIKTTDLQCEFEEFLDKSPVGIWLDKYFDSWEMDGMYAIARKQK